jgi:hypothetical protein
MYFKQLTTFALLTLIGCGDSTTPPASTDEARLLPL